MLFNDAFNTFKYDDGVKDHRDRENITGVKSGSGYCMLISLCEVNLKTVNYYCLEMATVKTEKSGNHV